MDWLSSPRNVLMLRCQSESGLVVIRGMAITTDITTDMAITRTGITERIHTMATMGITGTAGTAITGTTGIIITTKLT